MIPSSGAPSLSELYGADALFEANYFSQENALKLRGVRKYFLALNMENITSNVDR